MSFDTPDGPFVSLNVMCSGERYDPSAANSFGIDPNDSNVWRFRLPTLVKRLVETVASFPQPPVIALQEVPRVRSTGSDLFRKLLQDNFPDHTLLHGIKDDPSDAMSQLCLLFPKRLGKTIVIDTRNLSKLVPQFQPYYDKVAGLGPSRFQIVSVGEPTRFAVINVHPTRWKEQSTDPIMAAIEGFASQILKNSKLKCPVVYALGDWNRRRQELALPNNSLYCDVWSAVQPCHLLPMSAQQPRGALAWGPNPIDHLICISKQPNPSTRSPVPLVAQDLPPPRTLMSSGPPVAQRPVHGQQSAAAQAAAPQRYPPAGIPVQQSLGGVRVLVRTGNLCQCECDVIVNASNTQLMLGTGVSAAIRESCGPGFQEHLDQQLRSKGKVISHTTSTLAHFGSGLLDSWGRPPHPRGCPPHRQVHRPRRHHGLPP